MPVGREWSEYANIANLHTDKSSLADAAKKMNVSPRAVSMARTVRKKAAPEVVEKVESGEMTLNAAHETVKQSEQQPEQVGGKETELPSAEIDDQCQARIDKIVKLIRDLFSALDAARSRCATQELHNEIERIYLKAQKKKQARASELAQQKLNFSVKPNSENNNGRPETGAELSQQLKQGQAGSYLREHFPDRDASSSVVPRLSGKLFATGRRLALLPT